MRNRWSTATERGPAGSTGRSRVRTVVALWASLLLALSMGLATAAPANAVYATGGSGLYKGSINWFTWGTAGTNVGNGTYVNNTTVGGATLAVTCSVSNRTFNKTGGVLQAYRSGTWYGDSFDNLYNIGGTDYYDPGTNDWYSHNTMVAGLMAGPTALAVTANFDFSCSATLGGVAVPLQGLVMADAEASNSITTQEWIEATPVGTTTWRLIDSFNPTPDETGSGCDTTAYARRSGSTVRLYPDKDECFATPSGVLFMQGATAAHLTLKGGGQTAVALGVVISTDFGDAPASYGDAGSLFQPSWTGGTLADNTNNPIAKGPEATTTPIARATQVPPTTTLLGTRIDAESTYQASANASGDDTNGVDDEDAISPPGTVLASAGKTYSLPNVACAGPGYVSGWIDWNGNGAFDSGERSGVVQCTGSSVALSWTIPSDVKTTANSFLRLRIAGTAAAAGVATGMTIIGEVEDYPIGITKAVPGINVVKSASVTSVVGSGPVTYTYRVTNTGTEPLKPVALTDDKCASPAFVSGDTDGDEALDLTETWTYRCTQTLSYPTNAPSVTNIATATGTGTVSGLPVTDTDTKTVTVTPTPAAINATKSGVDVTASSPFDGTFTATYTVSVTNSGQTNGSYGALTDTPAFSSALTVLGASWTTSGAGAPAGGSATGAGPYTFAPAATTLAAGVTHTYTVKVTFKYAGTAAANVCDGTAGHGLFNSTSLPSGQETNTSDNSACLPPPPLNQGVTVAKSSVPADGSSVAPGSTVTYTITFTSTGTAGTYLDYVDHLAKVLDDASLNTGSFVSSSPQVTGAYDAVGQSIRIGGFLPAGQTVTFSYSVQVNQIDQLADADLLNVVVPHGTTPPTTCTVGDPLCTEHPVPTPSLALKKDIVARSTATDQFALTIQRMDGTSPVTVGSATTTGTSTGVQNDAVASVSRAVPGVGYRISEAGAGGTSLASYAIKASCVTGEGTAVVATPVSGQANAWDLSFPTTAGTPEVTCTITNEPTRPIHVDKLAKNCDVGQPTCHLPGAQFALYDTDPSVAGAVPLTGGITVDTAGDGSAFTSAGLADGDYWLVETKAPTGFALLADPIKFSLSATGVTLTESNTVVVVDPTNPFRIQVLDATAAPLPLAGGDGWWPFLGLGIALIAAAALISVRTPRASRTRTS